VHCVLIATTAVFFLSKAIWHYSFIFGRRVISLLTLFTTHSYNYTHFLSAPKY